MNTEIRQAVASDAEQILAIYRPIVEETTISFELVPPGIEEITHRIHSALTSHDWLVAINSAQIVGYAYAAQYRQREAYRFATETTVYVKANQRGKGTAKALYNALFQSLDAKGFRRAYAGISLPNAASVALHQAIGFEPIGVFPEAGYKFERWHDMSLWQRRIRCNDSLAL